MTVSAFSVFDSTGLTISKIDVTPGYTDTSGNWVPEATSTTTILGHVSDLSLKELAYIDPSIVAAGTRKISVESSVSLVPLDRITIVELAGDTTTWIVVSKMHASTLLKKHAGVSRETFLLKRQI